MAEREDLTPELRAAIAEVMGPPRDVPQGAGMQSFLDQQRRSSNIEDRRHLQGQRSAMMRDEAIKSRVNEVAINDFIRNALRIAQDQNVDPEELGAYVRDMEPRSRGINPDSLIEE